VRKKRLEDYAAKKSQSIIWDFKLFIFENSIILIVKFLEPGVIAKSSVVLDVKPWDDETDMQEMEKQVRTIQMDGLLWGACKYTSVSIDLRF
jgi:hypothetical protein